jgi:regulator of protease activity HflC (stomatin/prohibitin superfamily)
MNKVLGFSGLAAVLLLGSVASCSMTTIKPGNVGIKVSNWGSGTGVSSTSLPLGWYFTPVGVNIHEYPVFTQTYAWTKNANEETPINQEFDFQDKSGLSMTADISVAYHVDPSLAPKLFQTYRQEMSVIVAGPMRNKIRSMLNENSSLLGVEEIVGNKKTELINKTLRDVQKYFSTQGLVVEQLYWASSIRLPDSVSKQINNKIANEQQALAAQAAVATAEANARSTVATAEGKARAIQIEAAAVATNPQILQLKAIEKWKGDLPTYNNGPMPFVSIPNGK